MRQRLRGNRLLLIGRDLLVAAFCRGGVAIKGDLRLSCTSSINRTRRQAVSRDVGVTSLWSAVAWLSGWPSFVGVEGSGVAWPTKWPSCVGVEVPTMCLASSNPGGQDLTILPRRHSTRNNGRSHQ